MDADALADRLAAARRTGGMVADFPPLALADGYAVAARLALRLGEVIGWKIGATSAGAQAFLKVAAPIRGRMFAGGVWRDGATVTLPGTRALEVEPEIVFELGAGLAPVAAWFGVEIVRPSFADAFALGAGAIVADNAAHCGLLLGPPLPLAALDDPAALSARLLIDGELAASGSADAVLGDPRRALAALRTQLAGDARGLRPGDLVASGAMGRAAAIRAGQSLTLDAAGFGTAACRFATL